MREVHWEGAEPDDAFVGFMDACVQCRGCETACPSSVPFGRLMEGHARLARRRGSVHAVVAAARHEGARASRPPARRVTVLAVAQRGHLVPKRVAARLGVPELPLRLSPLEPTGSDVWLFTGCVMDAWQRPMHAAVIRVLGRAGCGVALPGKGGAAAARCTCTPASPTTPDGSPERVMSSMPGTAPIVVDSAGCGAALKDYGHLLNTPDAEAFSARVHDVHEWLALHMDALPRPAEPSSRRVAVQDPCHLRHVQRAHLSVRTVLQPYVQIVELDDEGLCCGAGGAYSALHPEMAGSIRERKVAAIDRAAADVVASANPGCALHLAAAGVDDPPSRWRSSTRRSMAGEFDDIRARLEAIAEELD